jgi:acetyl esterase/lipase
MTFQTLRHSTLLGVALCTLTPSLPAADPPRTVDVWPGLAPGEVTRDPGEPLPRRENEDPPATRISRITRPQMDVYAPPAGRANGAAVLILPGGGYNYVVQDKEGSEAAQWLNELGVTGCVLRYRTKRSADDTGWQRPLQDAQRALSLLRAQAATWNLQPDRIGILGFSAGGQAAALATTRFATRSYEAVDKADETSCRPDFALLIYPWNLWDAKTDALFEPLQLSPEIPPTFLVHAHDDSWSSLGSALFYVALKRQKVPAELHIYQTGGHGYGMRPVAKSNVATWPLRAAEWLRQNGVATAAP